MRAFLPPPAIRFVQMNRIMRISHQCFAEHEPAQTLFLSESSASCDPQGVHEQHITAQLRFMEYNAVQMCTFEGFVRDSESTHLASPNASQ